MGCCCSSSKSDKSTVFYSDIAKQNNDNSAVDTDDVGVEMGHNHISSTLFISFTEFKTFGTLPVFDINNKLVNHDAIDTDSSVVIYISHQWLRSSASAPDTPNNTKYKLIIEAVESILKKFTSMKKCYLWIDYSCLNHDKMSPDYGMIDKVLFEAISCCDIFLTIVCDDSNDDISLQTMSMDKWDPEYYKSEGLKNYWSRAWARMEVIISSNLLLKNNKPERLAMFKHGVAAVMKIGYRPHLLYGSLGYMYKLLPVQVPSYSPRSCFRRYDPFKLLPPGLCAPRTWCRQHDPFFGASSDEEDKQHIESLQAAIQPHLRVMEDKYVGNHLDLHIAKYMHGRGVYTYKNGSVYEGELRNDKFNGVGRFTFTNGCVYEGNFKNDKFDGYGILYYSNGYKYVGDFKNDLRHGKGTMFDADENVISEDNYKKDVVIR